MTTTVRSIAEIRRHRPDRTARAHLASAAEDDMPMPPGGIPMPAKARQRLKDGKPKPADLAAFRLMLDLSQPEFAAALGLQVATLRNWEQGRRTPDGAAIALLRLAARHPRLLLESLTLAG